MQVVGVVVLMASLAGCGGDDRRGGGGEDGGPERDGGGEVRDSGEAGDGGGGDAGGGDGGIDGGICARPDMVGDGVDQNCDGIDGVDGDRDRHASEASGGDDCDDTDARVHPGASEGWLVDFLEEATSGPAHDFVLDATGVGHVVYEGERVAGAYRLGYARLEGGAWTYEESSGVGHAARIAVGPDGAVHVAIEHQGITATYGTLEYMRRAPGGTWDDDVEAHDLINGGHRPDIALAPDGTVVMTDTEIIGDTMGRPYARTAYLITGAPGAWNVASVFDGVIGYPSVVVDAAGAIHVFGDVEDELRHHVQDAGGARVETLTTGIAFPDAAIGADGVVHALMRTAGGIRQMTLDTAGGAPSFAEVPGAPPSTGTERLSVAVDRDGAVHVCGSSTGIFYGTDASGAWTFETVDELSGLCTIALDATDGDRPHIVYAGGGGAPVRHAVRAGTPGLDADCDGRDD